MKLMDPPGGRPWALLVICGVSLALNLVLLTRVRSSQPAPVSAQESAIVAGVEPKAVAEVAKEAPAWEGDAAAEEPTVADAEAEGAQNAWGDADADTVAQPAGGLTVRHAVVRHSLARTMRDVVDEDQAGALAATVARLLVWELDLRRDLLGGDELSVAFQWEGDLPVIEAVTYTSQKLKKTLRAYRFHAAGDTYTSWWTPDGSEVAARLRSGPIDGYEQVTALLKDRPSHRGMDFKAPEGTDVVAPRAGRVMRTNWNERYNGHCVEVKYTDGTVARFLHLAETRVAPGARVEAGAVIGVSGNTGRSTAPHLHYELERGQKVIDPIAYHGTYRRALSHRDQPRFDEERRRLDTLLAGADGRPRW